MKKMLTTTLATMTLGVILFAQTQPPLPGAYEGPYDDTYWSGWNWSYYHTAVSDTTLGTLARGSDIIGVGVVSNLADDHFTVTVDHALVGSTNGQSIVVYTLGDHAEPVIGDRRDNPGWDVYFPTNNSRIVFAVFTNEQGLAGQNTLRWLNRSWWYPERDDGLLFTQFTNVIQAVRFDRNWTNYFYLCRDGANSASNRVREDSFWDLRSICRYATDEQMQFILNDPLVDQKHKDIMVYPNWRQPDID